MAESSSTATDTIGATLEASSSSTAFDTTGANLEPAASSTATSTLGEFVPNSSDGPKFDHEAVLISNFIGPVSDAFVLNNLERSAGPVWDIIVSTVPAQLTLGDSSPDDQDEVRDTIQPALVEFNSPNVYGLEKDADGNIVGFKF